jgi:hypothetical protein
MLENRENQSHFSCPMLAWVYHRGLLPYEV